MAENNGIGTILFHSLKKLDQTPLNERMTARNQSRCDLVLLTFEFFATGDREG